MFSFLRRRPSVRKLLPAGIDAHCHLLPGVDDGAPDMETALEIIRTQQALGLRGAICTPHIMARYPDNTPANLRRVFEQLVAAASTSSPNSTLSTFNLPCLGVESGANAPTRSRKPSTFQLHLAAEYMLDEAFPRLLEHPDRLLTIPSHLITPASTSSPNSTHSLSRRPVSAYQREAGSKEDASPNAETETFNLPCLGVQSRRINSGANAPTRSRKDSTSAADTEGKCAPCVNPASTSSPNSTLSTFNLQLSTSAAGNQDFILIELPQYLLPEGWLDVLDSIRACGLRPLLAHPERYLRLLSESDLADLHARGLRYQGNLGSLAGLYGPQVQRLARRLHKSGLYTTFGTDAHSAAMITKMDLAA